MRIRGVLTWKKDIVATATLTGDEKESIVQRLKTTPKTTQIITSEIKDCDQQIVAIMQTTWQIKSWGDVQTKVK